jgi:ribosomal protein L18E
MDDLESVVKTAAEKYRRLGGSTANLDKILKSKPTKK